MRIIILLFFILLIFGCKHKPEIKKTRFMTVQPHCYMTKLYFKGVLSPIKNMPVISPTDGQITQLFFKYGDDIKNRAPLAKIETEKLSNEFRERVTAYLQAKNTMMISKRSYTGTVALYKAGVLSFNEYQMDKNQYDNNILTYSQAKLSLESIVRKANAPIDMIKQLSIGNTAMMKNLLQQYFSSITVYALTDGIALFPPKKLNLGSAIKDGQLIVSLGDLSGLSVTVPVSEIDVAQIKTGLKAMVTGPAFPGLALPGLVIAVAKQANEFHLFTIEVQVPLTKQARNRIRVGMTATVEIDINHPPQIIVPVSAVFQKNGKNYVIWQNPVTQQKTPIPIITGETTLTGVTIISGLKAGDQVIIHD